MSAPALVITRSKKTFSEKSSQVALKLVPNHSDGKQADRKLFAMFVTTFGVIGLMFLLLINTLLAQDAFALSNLKLQAKLVSDQREAIARQIDNLSSPESLANAAAKLGMKPAETPTFLDLAKIIEAASVKNG